MRVASLDQHIRLGAYDEESGTEGKNKEPLEINVASVHDVEGARLWHDLVQDVHIVHIPTGDADECRNVAVQVQQSMHLDGGLALTKLRPREYRQTQIDGRRIQSVQTLIEIDTNFVVRVQWPGNANQYLRKIRKDPPIMRLIRVGQRRTRHLAAESQMVQLAFDRMQTRLDVAKTFSIGELCESHGQILIPAGKPAQSAVALIALNATAKLSIGKEAD